MLAARVQRVLAQRVEQHVGGEDVVAHRGVDLLGVVGQPDGVGRLLAERGDHPPVVGGLDDAELVGERDRLADRRHRHAGAGLDVLGHHLARVHAVDVVGAEDDDVARLLVADQVEALVDRVGRAGEPPRAQPLLGGDRRDVVAEHRRQPPGAGDVPVEAVALVLREHHDLAVAAVDQVGQHEVDEPVDPAERHGRLGAVGGQRHQALALAAGEDDGQDPIRHGANAIPAGRDGPQSVHARRPAHPRVPARGLRRRGRPRRVPRPRAAPAGRRAGALHGGTARRAGRHGVRRAGGAGRGQPGAAHPRHRPVDGRRLRRARTSCTRTPGTPTSPATWPSCSTACRTS